MKITLELPEDDKNYINNLAFIKALMIKHTIETMNISYDKKIEIKEEVLKYLKNGWIYPI